MYDPVALADTPLARPEPRYLTPNPASFKNYSCCPWAKTLIAEDHETLRPVLLSVTCKRWGCAYCAPRKIRRLAFLTQGAAPNRWIRLGVKPEKYGTPKEAWEDSSPKVAECFRKIRSSIGECEYLRVCELHASGFPHYHALLRSSFLPQRMLSKIWGSLTEAPVVWIAKIDQTFSSFRYLTKYLTKLHRIEWTDRHVAYSREFFRAEDTEKLKFPVHDVESKSDDHPWKYLADHFPGEEIAMEADGSFTLPHWPDIAQLDTPLDAFFEKPADPPPENLEPGPTNPAPARAAYLPGMEDADRAMYH